VTVIDTSGVVDFVLGVGVADHVEALMTAEGELAAPDVLVFEVLSVLRRHALTGMLSEERAGEAVEDLGDLPIELFPSLPIRLRVWSLRHNLTAADGLFVALAEQLDEPFATKDSRLAADLAKHSIVDVMNLDESG
jgi:predicted nucleic acid-binding protein